MIKFIYKLIFSLSLICVFIQSKAQVAPNGIVFQAVARDINNNAAANRNVYAIVNILEGNANGNNVYKESWQVVSTNEGVFTITIGQGTRLSGANSLVSLDWTNKIYFFNIQIAIQPTLPDPSWTPTNNYINIGTTQFWSVPYAIAALNAKFSDSASTINSILPGAKGGTGINNNGKTITLGNNIITKGIGDLTITTTAASNVIFPASGTLANTQYVSDRIATDTLSLSGRIIRDSILITKNNQGIIDTAAAIRLKLLDKIEASQFPNLIQPFLANTIYSFKDTITLSNRIDTKLNIADTADMLSSRIGRDTISLSNRIESIKTTNNISTNLKLNISDTSIMLSNRIARDTIGLSNRIGRDSILITKNKQGIVDTAAAIRLKLNDKIEASQFPNLIQPFLAGTIFSFNDTMTLSNRIDAEITRATNTENGLSTRITSNTSSITSNTTDIASLNTRVTSNTASITSNTANISSNTASITSNTSAIAGLDTRVNSNTASITSNTSAISALDTRVSSNTNAIAGLDTRVTSNTNSITANTTDIASLNTRVTSNTASITTNTSDIASNTNAIAGLDTRVTSNTSSITANTSDIASLSTRVTSNTTSITTNTSDIASNTSAIAGLDTRVTSNTSSITANTTAIAGLDTRVTSNTSSITANTTDIASLNTRVTSNTASITTNTSDIASNTNAIAALDTRVTSNTSSITAEITRATNAEAALDTRITSNTASITAEITRATNAESALSTRITSNTSSITAEITRATNAEAALDTRVTSNTGSITTNTADIASNTASITAEITRATNAEADLSTRITSNTSSITAEVTRAQAAELVLTNNVSANTSSITALDTRVTSNTSSITINTSDIASNTASITSNTSAIAALDTRVTSNTNAIAGLDTRVTSNTSSITANTTDIASLSTRVTSNTASITTNTSDIASNTSAIAGLDTRVTSNTNAIAALDTRVTSNTASITANTSDIASNTASITTNISDILLRATIASPSFTGSPTAPTAAPGTSTTQIATTEFVSTLVGGSGAPNATATVKGILKLTNDLGGSADLPTVNSVGGVSSLTITTLPTLIESNTASITTEITRATNAENDLSTRITSNTSSITSNTSAIAGLDTRVTSNTASITANTADIASLDTRVTSNTSSITANTTDIVSLNTRVTSNTASITANISAIAAEITRAEAAELVLTNNVSANTSSITALDTQVTSNTSSITTNTADITSNTVSITSNTIAIAGLDTRVTSNTNAIAALDTRVTSNTNSITANITDIASNTASITTNTADILLRATIASPSFTGSPTAPTAAPGTSTTQIATTEFVSTLVGGSGAPNATATVKGILKLTNDLGGSADLPTVNSVGGVSSLTITTLPTLIESNTASITTEVTRATNAEDELDTRITSNTVSITNNTNSIATNTASITAEITRATNAEAALDTRIISNTASITSNTAAIAANTASITAEITRATNAENALSTRITSNTSSITAEITRATNAEAALDTRIISNTASITSNTAAIAANTASITAEITRATNAENALSTRITSNTSSITAEITRATNAESALDTRITSNTSSITTNTANILLRATIASPSLTGTPTAPTAALATNTTQIATTQFVRSEIANMSLGSGTITGTLSVVNGGTGQSSFTDGQLLIGNSDGNTLSKSTLTAGNGVVITNGNGSIRIDVAGGTGGVGTVTNVNPITVNASGSTFTSTVTNASTTPAISLTIPLASVAGTTAGLLSNTDYEIFNAKQGALTAGSGISIASNTISATGLTTSNLSSSAGILNAQLANSEITLGSTAMSLGGTYTSLTGLSSVTSINFTGTLSGTASGLTTGRTISTTGDVAYTSAIFNGTADVTGAATVNSVGGVSSSTITTVASAVNSATSSNLANTIVKRDGAGDFVVGAITATALSSGTLSLTTPLSVLSGGTGTNSSTGTGMLVLSSSPALTGTPTAITAAPGTNSTQIATTAFVSALVGGSGAPDATSTVKGILQLTNDLGGSAELPIVNSVGGVSSSTITTVASSVNSATSSNTANTIVKRDVSGAFAAGAITANSVLTNALNVTSGTYTRSGSVLTSDALGNATWGTSGLYRLNGIIATNQTFAATITSTFVTPSYTSAGSVHTLNLPLASYSSTTAGLLSKADYDVFNAKQGALKAGADYIVPNSAITGATKTKITYDEKGLVTAGADATTADIAPSTDRNYVTDIKAGVLSNTSGVNTGDQTITLTGDVTGMGTGTFTSTIANSAVTYAKMQNVTAGKLLGSISASDAAPGAVAIGSGLSLSGGTLTASGTGGTVTSVNPITVTASGSTFTSTVTNASTTPAIALTIPLASEAGTTAGLLSNTDYAIFNAKQGALTAGAGSGISISGGTISATGITTSNLSSTAGITNGQLANSAITLGSTSMSLGSTNTTIAGLTSVTSTGFTGALTGNASTATALATARSIYGNNFDGTAALSGVISTTFGGTGASSTSQNFVFAGPTSGAGAPGFRLLTSADVPAGSGNYIANGTTQQASSNFNISGSGVVGTSLSAGSLSLTTALSVANGGTGATTLSGLVKGNGTSAMTAAVAGTDFVAPNSAITSATKTKITYDTKGLVTAGADATTADIAPSTDRNYVTDIKAGVLSNTSGVNTGDQTITLTGDVTGTGTGTFTSTIANSAVTYAKMQNVTAGKLLGSISASDAAPGAVAIGSGLTLSGGTLTASGTGGTVTSVNPITVNSSGSTFTSSVTNASTTPAISLTIPLASVTGTTAGLLSKADYDVFNGKQSAISLRFRSGGDYNIGIGARNGYETLGQALTPTGTNNIAIGNNAMGVYYINDLTGSHNIALGTDAGGRNSTGSDNIFLGSSSGMNNYNGSQNTFIGRLADVSPEKGYGTGFTNATAVGYEAKVTGSNKVQLGNGSVTNVSTYGTLTAGSVTYPNSHNSTANQILTINSGGVASWADAASGVSSFSGGTTGLTPATATTGAITLAGILNSENGGTGNGFTEFTGPTTAKRTFTLPNASATILTSNAAVTAAQGGTSQSTYATGDILYASATNTLSKLGIGATGTVLTVSGGVPSWGSTSGITGTGTQNYLPKYGAGGTTITNSMIFDNGTSVGINTANPGSAFKLDVNGAANFASDIVVNGIKIGKRLDPGYEMYATSYGVNALANYVVGAYGATAFGNNALQANTNGAYNNAFGIGTLSSLTTGSGNTAIGSYASNETSDASNNVIIGHEAGRYLNTSDNTIIGYRAGQTCCTTNSVNIKNIYIGSGSGNGTAGSKNVIIGSFSGSSLGTINNNIILSDGDGTIRYRWDGTTNNFNTGSVTASSFIKSGGTNAQYLMADGSTSAGPSGGVTTISGGTTGLTPSTATSGVVTLAGTLVAANGGTGQSTYAKGDILYASATNTLSKLTIGSEGQVLVTTSTGIPSWGSNGLYSLNSQTATSHSFAISSSTSNALGWSSSSSGTPLVATHTLTIPDATSSVRGFIGTGSQSIAGEKTFSNDLSANGVYIGRGTNSRATNIAIGSSANVGGKNFSANLNSTTAINNIAIGVTTLSSLGDGYSNNAVGNGALSTTNGGYQNNAFGFEALKGNTSGDNNSGFGHSALIANSTGNDNTAVGYNSLISTTGSQNTAIGSTSNVAAAKSNSTAIGYGASVSDNNTIQLGNTSVTDVKTSGKVTASQFVVSGGTATQVLMANGSYGTMPAAHYVGESYGGGIVFYVYDNGQHGLIAATSDQTTGERWALYTSRVGGAQVDGIGAGMANTKLIINSLEYNSQSAARTCFNYYATQNVGGVNIYYTDWYLPSKTELLLLYQQRSTVGGFVSGGYYWTSQQVNDQDSYAWTMGFTGSGDMSSSGLKTLTSIRVRAIRHF